MKQCDKCKGNGSIECTSCNGMGESANDPETDCEKCSGTGEMWCSECDGTGEVEDE